MKRLKRLGAAIALTFALGVSAFAGETPTGPCAPPEPGIVSTPPCSGAQNALDEVSAPGQLDSPPASAMVEAAALTINLFENLLLF
jgi:hypothetical protein